MEPRNSPHRAQSFCCVFTAEDGKGTLFALGGEGLNQPVEDQVYTSVYCFCWRKMSELFLGGCTKVPDYVGVEGEVVEMWRLVEMNLV